jgi:hypothetical protein
MAHSKTSKQAVGGDDNTAADEKVTLYTLSDLLARLGKATDEEIATYVEGHTKAELIEEGVKVGTDRIDTDCARLYGQVADFFDRASEAQLDALIGVSPDMLRAAVSAGNRGSQLASQLHRGKKETGAGKVERAATAAEVREKGVAYRKSLRAGLSTLAAGDKKLLAAVDGAAGTLENLPDALDGLVKVGRRMLKKPGPALAQRLAKSRLTAAKLDEIEKLAEDIRTKGDAADAVAGHGEVSQSEVDYWDGINLFLLGAFIDIFDAGHAIDPTIPRLSPISLRNYYRPSRSSAAAPTEQPPVGGTSGASGTG